MNIISINPCVFPLVGSCAIKSNNGSEICIDFPMGVHLLYLSQVKDPTELDLLRKYSMKEKLSDEEYKGMLSIFLNNTPRLDNSDIENGDILSNFGVMTEENDGEFRFRLIPEFIPQIRVETWDYIVVDLLRESYTDIINCFDFGKINIDLGEWRSEFDEQKQSLLSSFRSALMFTLIGFLYDNGKVYTNFQDYFEEEFYKRIAFIYAIWKHRQENEIIHYIPIYDSFYNLQGKTPKELIKIINTILSDDEIVMDEKLMIKKRLVSGAEDFHNNIDQNSKIIESQIIKPTVNYICELESSEQDILAATKLCEEMFYEASIDRCYYAMMHALKALLENKGELNDWQPGKLNVKANHKELELKLVKLESENDISNSYVVDFKYVKNMRWDADYNISMFNKNECINCISKSINFINEVKRITL